MNTIPEKMIGNNRILVFENSVTMAAWLAEKVIAGALACRNRRYAVALSGGNTPKLFFKALAVNSNSGIDVRQVIWFWSDERCVPFNDEQSNFTLADKLFFSQIECNYTSVFRIWGEDEPIGEAARYERVIRGILPKKNGIPIFDMMILGLGVDGHTASIFPETISLLESDVMVAATHHPQTKQPRITLTGPVITAANEVLYLVSGNEKSGVLADILLKRDGYERFPAAQISQKASQTIWLVDQEAAAEIRDIL